MKNKQPNNLSSQDGTLMPELIPGFERDVQKIINTLVGIHMYGGGQRGKIDKDEYESIECVVDLINKSELDMEPDNDHKTTELFKDMLQLHGGPEAWTPEGIGKMMSHISQQLKQYKKDQAEMKSILDF